MARKRVLNAADWRGPSGVKAVCAALARYQNCPSPPLTTNASWLPGATSGQIPRSRRSQASLRRPYCLAIDVAPVGDDQRPILLRAVIPAIGRTQLRVIDGERPPGEGRLADAAPRQPVGGVGRRGEDGQP